MKDLCIGFIGLGLIGGSIAKALRLTHPNIKIIAFNRSEAPRLEAKRDGTADIVCDCVDNTFSECDYIFLCTPVEYNAIYLKELKRIIKNDCVITDVGSTKSDIHKVVIDTDMEANFIGGHPMAGSEKTGYESSSSKLIENAFYAITPTSQSEQSRIDELTMLIKDIGGIPIIIDYKKHDFAVATISHLPHLIASSLVNLVKDNDFEDGTMKLLAAGGFKDITRIASSSPVMWQQICCANSDNLITLIDKYCESLNEIKESLVNKDPEYIYKTIEKSRDYRNSFSDIQTGPILPQYSLYCDIADESGAISTIATILSKKGISIKNIGIVNNREHSEGVLKMVFYDMENKALASELLKKNNYIVF